MPWPNGTTPPRIRQTMPSETRPLPAAIVSRKVSHLGANEPTTREQRERAERRRRVAHARAGEQSARRGSRRHRHGRGRAHQIRRAWVRWNSPSGRNIRTIAITT